MIPDALISCSYLVLCCGCCINRLLNYSRRRFSKILPEFVIGSIGVAAIGARSFHALFYNIFWRSYPIDPRAIAGESERVKYDENVVDLILGKGAIGTLVYSFYYHYRFFSTGFFFVLLFTTLQVLLVKAQTPLSRQDMPNFWRRFSTNISQQPYSPLTFWILSNELFGRAVGNDFFRLANVPYTIATWAFPPEAFYQGSSIINTINDYTMICYIILITEGLCT